MSKLSENLQSIIQKRIQQTESTLSETKEWIERMKAAGFDVSDLQTKQALAEQKNDRLRMLL